MELVDAETGDVLKLGLSNETRREYTNAFDLYADEIRRLAQRNGGRYVSLPSSASLEESVFGALVRTQGVA
jgi:hypothetical protein